jgi:hypothetical protein
MKWRIATGVKWRIAVLCVACVLVLEAATRAWERLMLRCGK